jgi:hypothetical protein
LQLKSRNMQLQQQLNAAEQEKKASVGTRAKKARHEL